MHPEGWTFVIGSPKWHYVRNHRSLCNRWGLPLLSENSEGIEQGNNDSPDNCATCRKKLEKEIAAHA